MLGGTAAYSALTARALGKQAAIVTSFADELDVSALSGIEIANCFSTRTTTFRNIYNDEGRVQYVFHPAHPLGLSQVPQAWLRPAVIHLGPVAQEVDPNILRSFPCSLRVITPQGYLRRWDESGRVFGCEWPEAAYVLGLTDIAVISVEDVNGDESMIEEFASSVKILVVTEGSSGCRVFWNGDVRRFPAYPQSEVDATGAGDIFATAYFVRYNATSDPWESARFANLLASGSLRRLALAGIPTQQEIQDALVEIIK